MCVLGSVFTKKENVVTAPAPSSSIKPSTSVFLSYQSISSEASVSASLISPIDPYLCCRLSFPSLSVSFPLCRQLDPSNPFPICCLHWFCRPIFIVLLHHSYLSAASRLLSLCCRPPCRWLCCNRPAWISFPVVSPCPRIPVSSFKSSPSDLTCKQIKW